MGSATTVYLRIFRAAVLKVCCSPKKAHSDPAVDHAEAKIK